MAGQYFYTTTTDANLVNDLLAGCGELYIQRHEYQGTATLTLVGGGNDTLTLNDSGVAADDAYNSSVADNLYIIDDNGALARGKVIDTFSESTGTLVEFEANNMVLVSDGLTAPTLSDATDYTVQILSGSNNNLFGDFFGYMDDSVEWDPTPETEPLEVCNIYGQMVEVAEKVNKRMNTLVGATFNVPNSDVVSKVLNMEQYGLNNSTQSEYHGGSSPNINVFYQITVKSIDWNDANLAWQLFKGQLMNNGAIAFTGTSWKSISWIWKGKRDTMRASNRYDYFRFIRGF